MKKQLWFSASMLAIFSVMGLTSCGKAGSTGSPDASEFRVLKTTSTLVSMYPMDTPNQHPQEAALHIKDIAALQHMETAMVQKGLIAKVGNSDVPSADISSSAPGSGSPLDSILGGSPAAVSKTPPYYGGVSAGGMLAPKALRITSPMSGGVGASLGAPDLSNAICSLLLAVFAYVNQCSGGENYAAVSALFDMATCVSSIESTLALYGANSIPQAAVTAIQCTATQFGSEQCFATNDISLALDDVFPRCGLHYQSP